MAEENKHPPTTEEQAPPEMPGKAPKMEQAEIPDVGGGPAPSAKVIDLSAVRSTPEKDAPPDIPKETGGPVRFRHRVQQAGMGKAHAGAGEAQAQTGPPCKKPKKLRPPSRGPRKRKRRKSPAVAVRPRRKKTAPEQAKPPKAGKTHAAPEERQRPRPRKCRLRPVTLPAPKKRKSSILTFPTCTRSRIILSVSVTMRK